MLRVRDASKQSQPIGQLINQLARGAVGWRGLGVVVGLTLPMARADRGLRPVYYLLCSDLGQVVNLSLSVA